MIHDPAQLVVYQRPTPGQGQFSALPTTYDAGTQKLRVTTTQMGEFIFAYPDLAETPYVPTILSPADQSEVNQAAPVTLTWMPQGLVGSFDLQVATNAAFADLVLDTNGLGSGSYVLQRPIAQYAVFLARPRRQPGRHERLGLRFVYDRPADASPDLPCRRRSLATLPGRHHPLG